MNLNVNAPKIKNNNNNNARPNISATVHSSLFFKVIFVRSNRDFCAFGFILERSTRNVLRNEKVASSIK